jgi:DNA polymerase-3 subunit gamma/tau
MTLYRKYRPQNFADFVNQKPIKLTIQNQILQGKTTHVYLFTGPRGTGKTTMARLLSKAINCQTRPQDQFEPCNKCQSCQEIAKGISLDLEEKDAASNRGIDEIRNLRDKIRFAPSGSKYKIFIIDEAHMLTAPAFNALLKTLEEPPENTVFVLATTEPHKLPETIISRCQRFDFKKIRHQEIVDHLSKIAKSEKVKVQAEVLENIALRSDGCVRDGLSILGKIISLGVSGEDKKISWDQAELIIPRSDRELIKKFVSQLEKGETQTGIALISHLMAEGIDLDQFCLDLIDYLRERMIETLSPFYSELIDIFLKRYEDLKRATFLPQLPLELGVLDSVNIKCQNPNVKSMSKSKCQNKKIGKQQKKIISALDLKIIKQKWPEILNKIKEHNHSLPVALSACQPLRIEGNKLILGFKYPIHHDQIMSNQKNRSCLEKIISDVCQTKILINGEVVQGLKLAEKTNKKTRLGD